MGQRLRGIAIRVAVVVAIFVLAFVLESIAFAQYRSGSGTETYNARFANVGGLRKGNFVRIAGVEVGKVKDIVVDEDATVRVKFTAEKQARLTESSRAEIRYDDLIGGRYLEVVEGAPGAQRQRPGQMIPLARTKPPLDLDSVTGGFRPLLRGLDPPQLNALSGEVIKGLKGENGTISAVLDQAAVVTNTLADRDLLIGEVVENLDVVLGSLGPQSEQLDKAVMSFSQLVGGLAARKTDISSAIAHINAASATVASVVGQTRPSIKKIVYEGDRTGVNLLRERDFIDNQLAIIPDKLRMLLRQAIYGNFFSFYFCDVMLKLNGKGGQPVYVRLASQQAGRCLPK